MLGPEIRLELGGLVLEEWPQHLRRARSRREDAPTRQIEGRIFLMRPGLIFQARFALAVDQPPDTGPIDRAGAHRAGFGRAIKRAACQKVEVVGPRRPRSDQT